MVLIDILLVHLGHISSCICLKLPSGGNDELYDCQYGMGVSQNVWKFPGDFVVPDCKFECFSVVSIFGTY